MTQAVLSLGSNTSPRGRRIEEALRAIDALPCTSVRAVSTIVETEPVDVPDEFRGLLFKNCVAVVDTELEAAEFSRLIHGIEIAQGRVRGPVRNAPRTIDIDIVTFGDLVQDDPELTLPHPRARQRSFVMEPLAEVLPDFKWPGMV